MVYIFVIDLPHQHSLRIKVLSNKYNTTLIDTEKEIKECEKDLCSLLDELVGNDFDMKGISEFKSLLNGDLNG